MIVWYNVLIPLWKVEIYKIMAHIINNRYTQKKGDLAKSIAITYFTSIGYDVGIMLTESAKYDLLVDIGDSIKRVQVKYSINKYVDLRNIHSNSKGYVVNKYNGSSFDWLFVYNPNIGSFLVKDGDFTTTSITMRDDYKI